MNENKLFLCAKQIAFANWQGTSYMYLKYEINVLIYHVLNLMCKYFTIYTLTKYI